MKRRRDHTPLLNKHRLSIALGKHFDIFAHCLDNRRANEHHLERLLAHFRRQQKHIARELPSVRVPHDRDIHQSQRRLRRSFHFARQNDRTCASPKKRAAVRRHFSNCLVKPRLCQHLHVRRTFATRQNQPVDAMQILGRAHKHILDAQFLEHARVRFKVSLYRQYPNLHFALFAFRVSAFATAPPCFPSVTPAKGASREVWGFSNFAFRISLFEFRSTAAPLRRPQTYPQLRASPARASATSRARLANIAAANSRAGPTRPPPATANKDCAAFRAPATQYPPARCE